MITTEALQQSVREGIEETRRRRNSFVELEAEGAEIVAAYDAIREPVDEPRDRCSLFSSVHPDAAIRSAAEELERELSELETELSLDRGVYDRLAGVDEDSLSDPQAARLLEHALRDFRRAGVDRDEATRNRVRELQKELVDIGQTFDRNIVQGGRELVLEEGHAALGGLPEDYIAARPENADGAVVLTTDPPDAMPFMMYSERADLRERYLHELQNRAVPENLEVLPRLLERRHELAVLLGYDNWAQFVTEDKMVRRPERVREFLDQILDRASTPAVAEYTELLAEKRKSDPEAADVREWERLNLLEGVKRSRFGFDSQEVRPYFAYNRVKQGVLDTAGALFGLDFVHEPEAAVWHSDVEVYAVREGGETVARFYLDMFPREGKYKHAAMFGVRRGLEGRVVPEAALVCNFPRPDGDDPGLMLHGQVTTLFHEFGHLLHSLLAGRQRYLSFSGIATEWDFVEVPSQLFEEWAWDARVLRTFATHHETDEPIPFELVERLRAADEYGKGLHVQQQMLYARISLDLYSSDPKGVDVAALVRRLRGEITQFEPVEGTHFEAAFGHLHGYSALYYTYMWSLVIAKDLFGEFGEDPMDPDAAGRYRREVLAPGGARDAAEMVRSFLGRDYELAAWEAWLRR